MPPASESVNAATVWLRDVPYVADVKVIVFAVIVDVRHASVKLMVKDLLLVTDGVDVSVVPLKYIDWEPNIEFRAEKSETV